jgi:hypothetical protein
MADEPIEPIHEVKPIDDMVPAQPHRNRRSYFRQYLDSLLRLKHWQGWWRKQTPETPPENWSEEEEPPVPEAPPPPGDDSHINRQG